MCVFASRRLKFSAGMFNIHDNLVFVIVFNSFGNVSVPARVHTRSYFAEIELEYLHESPGESTNDISCFLSCSFYL